jgi:hypothetical protein
MTTLDELIREQAAKGNITHISITPNADGTWHACFTPAVAGHAMADGADPVEALKAAIKATPKPRSRVAKPTPEPEPVSALDDAYDPAA